MSTHSLWPLALLLTALPLGAQAQPGPPEVKGSVECSLGKLVLQDGTASYSYSKSLNQVNNGLTIYLFADRLDDRERGDGWRAAVRRARGDAPVLVSLRISFMKGRDLTAGGATTARLTMITNPGRRGKTVDVSSRDAAPKLLPTTLAFERDAGGRLWVTAEVALDLAKPRFKVDLKIRMPVVLKGRPLVRPAPFEHLKPAKQDTLPLIKIEASLPCVVPLGERWAFVDGVHATKDKAVFSRGLHDATQPGRFLIQTQIDAPHSQDVAGRGRTLFLLSSAASSGGSGEFVREGELRVLTLEGETLRERLRFNVPTKSAEIVLAGAERLLLIDSSCGAKAANDERVGLVTVWNTKDGSAVGRLHVKLGAKEHLIALAGDDTRIFLGTSQGRLLVGDPAQPEGLAPLQKKAPARDAIEWLGRTADAQLLVLSRVGERWSLQRIDPASGKAGRKIRLHKPFPRYEGELSRGNMVRRDLALSPGRTRLTLWPHDSGLLELDTKGLGITRYSGIRLQGGRFQHSLAYAGDRLISNAFNLHLVPAAVRGASMTAKVKAKGKFKFGRSGFKIKDGLAIVRIEKEEHVLHLYLVPRQLSIEDKIALLDHPRLGPGQIAKRWSKRKGKKTLFAHFIFDAPASGPLTPKTLRAYSVRIHDTAKPSLGKFIARLAKHAKLTREVKTLVRGVGKLKLKVRGAGKTVEVRGKALKPPPGIPGSWSFSFEGPLNGG
ncbi:MAG: hypothetical protein JKY65_13090 [Planctomycetes bacterium]|nr:hypothetical protein [Planctomycetota bacterium]